MKIPIILVSLPIVATTSYMVGGRHYAKKLSKFPSNVDGLDRGSLHDRFREKMERKMEKLEREIDGSSPCVDEHRFGRKMVRFPVDVANTSYSPGRRGGRRGGYQDRRREKLERKKEWVNRAMELSTSGPLSFLSLQFQVLSDDSASVVAVDVPGVPMSDIDITIDEDDRILTISGQRDIMKDGVSQVIKFSRTFQFDERARLDDIRATLSNGVLTVSAPKDPVVQEKTKARRLEIELVDNDENATKTD